MKKYFIIGIIPILLLINSWIIPTPKIENLRNQENLLYLSPIALRILVPNGEHFIADYFWLITKYIDEVGNKKVDIDKFFQAYKSLIILDASFETAVIYSATYLATVPDKPKLAIKLLELALEFYPNNFQYLFTDLIFKVIYTKYNLDEVVKLADRIAKLPDIEKKVGKINVATWSEDIIQVLKIKKTELKNHFQKQNR